MKKQIAVFASGNGSNAENLITYFNNSKIAQVGLVLTNNPDAGVIQRAKRLNVPVCVFSKKELQNSTKVEEALKSHQIDWIVLAGFLLLFPQKIIQSFPNKIINIHPALLPKYGGKGMYGMRVHKTVAENKETETGITIHFVNENYDEGKIIFQSKTDVKRNDTPEDIAAKIHQLEYKWFPKVIEEQIKIEGFQ
ncbi:phosphoribosylglycinamide formyltransferase [Planktosalinus lacus]|uniref:Phosphoribosylglycinamide formyltransferase n=1 Tax=Planktosalinus lacus TaxID=1526573 RepID=A0A8J2Y849_9FLAO|nr:phosphoribosylglycinamide formyltransferase [Planktosalinus lacus]GGD81045.1 phosphoribosylglycinamide formyltransferase [Planktosalinus lacus]